MDCKHHQLPSQPWKTLLRNHANCIAAVDFLIVPTTNFKLLYCLVIAHHGTRKLVHFDVVQTLSAVWIIKALREAFPWDEVPEYLIRNNEGVYAKVFKKRLSAMGIRDRPTTRHPPLQITYIERLIGSIRKEFLDHIVIFNEGHLSRIMERYVKYYDKYCANLLLDKDSPLHRPIDYLGSVTAVSILVGLHHRYCRIE